MGVTTTNPNMAATIAVVAEGSFNVMTVMTVRVVFILDDVEAARVLQIFYTFLMKRRAATGGRKVAAIEKMPTVIGKESVGMATTLLRLLCRVQQRKLSWSLMPLIVELLSTVRNFLGSADSRGSVWSLIEDSDPMKMAAILIFLGIVHQRKSFSTLWSLMSFILEFSALKMSTILIFFWIVHQWESFSILRSLIMSFIMEFSTLKMSAILNFLGIFHQLEPLAVLMSLIMEFSSINAFLN